MIDLGKYRIVQIDRYNITYEEYRDVENNKTKETTKKWVRVGGYYSTLQTCIKSLKEYIISQKLETYDLISVKDVIDFLDNLNGSYVNCNLNIKEDDNNEL